MIARARIVAEADSGGVTRLTQLRSEPPLLLRTTAQAVYLVGGAAGPLGGDDLCLEIEVGAGAHLVVKSAGASLALPGAKDLRSQLRLNVRVQSAGSLYWLVEPMIAGARCNHATTTELFLEAGAELLWREELILGRHDEKGGRISSKLSLELGGCPILRNELVSGPESPGWDGPAVLGNAKAAGSLLFSHPRLLEGKPTARVTGRTGALLPLEGPAVLYSALAKNPIDLRNEIDGVLAELGFT